MDNLHFEQLFIIIFSQKVFSQFTIHPQFRDMAILNMDPPTGLFQGFPGKAIFHTLQKIYFPSAGPKVLSTEPFQWMPFTLPFSTSANEFSSSNSGVLYESNSAVGRGVLSSPSVLNRHQQKSPCPRNHCGQRLLFTATGTDFFDVKSGNYRAVL